MAVKSTFAKFMSVLKKHLKTEYPFAMQSYEPIDAALPKSSSFYLGVSPIYGKHVVLNFFSYNKPWTVGQFTITVHISTEYLATKNWDALSKQYDSFSDGYYSLPIVSTGKDKVWCLQPNAKEGDKYTDYWSPDSYESEEAVMQQAVVDVCQMLEKLFRKAGFIDGSGNASPATQA